MCVFIIQKLNPFHKLLLYDIKSNKSSPDLQYKTKILIQIQVIYIQLQQLTNQRKKKISQKRKIILKNKRMQQSLELNFIYDRKYQDRQTVLAMEQTDYFNMVKKGIDQLLIDKNFFSTVVRLIDFFKFPILITLKKPIQKILKNENLLFQHEGSIKKLAKLAKNMIGSQGQIYQLEFLFKKGIDHTYCHEVKISSQKKLFIEYIKILSEQKHKLLEKLKEKTIKQEDLLKFQSKNFNKELKFFQLNFQNYIKSDIRQIEKQYLEIMRQQKIKEKKLHEQKQLFQGGSGQNGQKTEQKAKQQKILQQSKSRKQDENLEDISVCCRRFFYYNQLIFQPQSIHFIYKNFGSLYDNKFYNQILKNVCGLLNAQGGYLLIGIKQDKNTCKKQVEGFTLLEKQKQQLKTSISEAVDKCVLPNISHDMLKVLFVPIKDPQSKSYISGKFLIKICVRYGERKQFYSYREHMEMNKKQYFAIRTDNDTKIITNGQQILNIYKDRLLETPPDPKPIHPQLCPKPQIGKPLYEREQFGKKQQKK